MSKDAPDEKPKVKKGKDKKSKDASAGGPSVAAHPRARAQVRRAKGIGGLAGFVIAGYLSLKAGVPGDQVGLRALGAGIGGYMLAWAAAVTVWRHLVMAELRAAVERGMAPPPSERPQAEATGGES